MDRFLGAFHQLAGALQHLVRNIRFGLERIAQERCVAPEVNAQWKRQDGADDKTREKFFSWCRTPDNANIITTNTALGHRTTVLGNRSAAVRPVALLYLRHPCRRPTPLSVLAPGRTLPPPSWSRISGIHAVVPATCGKHECRVRQGRRKRPLLYLLHPWSRQVESAAACLPPTTSTFRCITAATRSAAPARRCITACCSCRQRRARH